MAAIDPAGQHKRWWRRIVGGLSAVLAASVPASTLAGPAAADAAGTTATDADVVEPPATTAPPTTAAPPEPPATTVPPPVSVPADTAPLPSDHVTQGNVFPLRGLGIDACANSFGAPRSGGTRRHQGNDCFAAHGHPLVAVEDGTIIKARHTERGLGGITLWLLGDSGHAYYYAHNALNLAAVGDRVEKGEIIALVGNTGNARSTPPHVHFEIRPAGRKGASVDPYPYLAAWASAAPTAPSAAAVPAPTAWPLGPSTSKVGTSTRFDAQAAAAKHLAPSTSGARIVSDLTGDATVEQWAHQLLAALSVEPTEEHTVALIAFAWGEAGGMHGHLGRYNPLNTKRTDPDLAARPVAKGVTVDYASFDDGVEATARAFESPEYVRLLDELRRGGTADEFFDVLADPSGGANWSGNDADERAKYRHLVSQVRGDRTKYANAHLRADRHVADAPVPAAITTTTVRAAEATYVWDFGDGHTAEGPVAEHAYASPGRHHVSVTIVGADGHQATVTHPIEVTAFVAANSARVRPGTYQLAPPLLTDAGWLLRAGQDSEPARPHDGGLIVPGRYMSRGTQTDVTFTEGVFEVRDPLGALTLGSGLGTAMVVDVGDPDGIPVPADYLGTGLDQFAAYSDGLWSIADAQHATVAAPVTVQFGSDGDIPVPADYLGTGRAQLAVYTPDGRFRVQQLSAAAELVGDPVEYQVGQPGDIPVPGLWLETPDSLHVRTQPAVWRPETGEWLVQYVEADGAALEHLHTAGIVGGADAVPVPGLYWGDTLVPAVWTQAGGLDIYRPVVTEAERLIEEVSARVLVS